MKWLLDTNTISYLLHRHRRGEPIEDADLLIAVTAVKQNAVLVTHNIRHFSGLGLQLEDWCLEDDAHRDDSDTEPRTGE